MKCWKVVSPSLMSARSAGEFTHTRVQYAAGKYVSAPAVFAAAGYHLLAFGSLQDAQEFACPDERVFLAEGIGPCRTLPPILSGNALKYDEPTPIYRIDLCTSWPRGTRMFRKIKLVKEVPPCPTAHGRT